MKMYEMNTSMSFFTADDRGSALHIRVEVASNNEDRLTDFFGAIDETIAIMREKHPELMDSFEMGE